MRCTPEVRSLPVVEVRVPERKGGTGETRGSRVGSSSSSSSNTSSSPSSPSSISSSPSSSSSISRNPCSSSLNSSSISSSSPCSRSSIVLVSMMATGEELRRGEYPAPNGVGMPWPAGTVRVPPVPTPSVQVGRSRPWVGYIPSHHQGL